MAKTSSNTNPTKNSSQCELTDSLQKQNKTKQNKIQKTKQEANQNINIKSKNQPNSPPAQQIGGDKTN